MTDWQIVTVDELAAKKKGSLATGPFGSSIGSKTFRDSGIPLIRGSNLSECVEIRLDETGIVYVEEDLAREFARSVAVKGDLVFTCWGTISQVGLIDDRASFARYIVSNKQMKLTLDEALASPLFVYYFFSSPQGQHQIQINAIGSSVPGFNLTKLKGISIPLPPLGEQHRIVELLSSLDDKIELNRRMNETLEAMAQAIFRDWFVDFGPTRRKLEGASDPVAIMGGLAQDADRARALADFFPATLREGGLPEGWVRDTFGAVIDIVGGGTPKTSVDHYWNGPIPWFSVVDTPPKGSVFVDATEKTISAAGLENSAARLVRAGTTIISARGTVGNLAMASRDMAFNQSCYGLQGKGSVGDCFVFLAAQNTVERLRAMAHGSVFSTITRATFDSVDTAYGDQRVFEAFEEIVRPLFNKISSNVHQNRTLAATSDLLLPKLMSGEIRLSEPEDLVEAAQ